MEVMARVVMMLVPSLGIAARLVVGVWKLAVILPTPLVIETEEDR
jgi:hypothetical protein